MHCRFAPRTGPRSRRPNTRESAASPAGTPGSSGSCGCEWWSTPRVSGGSLVQQGSCAALPRRGAAHRVAGWPRLHPDAGHELPGGGQRRTPSLLHRTGRSPLYRRLSRPLSRFPLALQELAMLELRPNCECCDRDLPADTATAYICSFECTFCAECNDRVSAPDLPQLWRRAGQAPAPPGGCW